MFIAILSLDSRYMSETKNLSPEITVRLAAVHNGNREAMDALIPLVYDELRRQAQRYLRRERESHTLQTTALINEAYLRLVAQKDVEWQNRAHFFGMAANMMRRILVDYAKSRHRVKRGGVETDLPIEKAYTVAATDFRESAQVDLIALDSALNKLAATDEQQARVVELRYFSGLTIEETAEVLNVSAVTVKRDWNVSKAWLRREIGTSATS